MLRFKCFVCILINTLVFLTISSVCFGEKNDAVIIEFGESMDNVCESYECSVSGVESSNENVGNNSLTGKMEISAPVIDTQGNIVKKGESDARITLDNEFNACEYNYVNILIYSPSITTSKLSFGVYCNNSGQLSSNYRFSGGLLIDFSGWKVFSMPISEFSNDMDWEHTKTFRISANVYDKPLTQYGWMEATYVNIDKIWFSSAPVMFPEKIGCYPQNNYMNMNTYKPTIRMCFNNLLKYSDSKINAILFCDGEAEDIHTAVNINGNELQIQIDSLLKQDTEYCIKIDSGLSDIYLQEFQTEYRFKTSCSELGTERIKFSQNNEEISILPQEGSIKASAEIYNFSKNNQTAIIAIASYDSENQMTAINFSDYENSEIAPNEQKNVSVVSSFDISSASSVKAFIINSQISPAIISGEYGVLVNSDGNYTEFVSGEDTDNNGKVSFTENPTIDENVLSVTGTAGDLTEAVFISIQDADGKIFMIEPVSVHSDGSFSYIGKINLKKGDYQCIAQTTYSDCEYDFYYISEEEKKQIVKKINGAVDYNSLKKIINENIAAFNLPEQSSEQKENDVLVIYDGKPYDNFSVISERLLDMQQCMKELSECRWSDIDAALIKNHDLILGNNSNYTYYSTLLSKNRLKICESFNGVLPITSLSKFRVSFDNAVAAYKKSLNSNSSNGGGGGGGGGGSASKKTGSTYSVPIVNATQNNPIETDKKDSDTEFEFIDMTDVQWASEAVNSLLKKGSISKTDDKKFRPDDYVTREEFIKMLISAMDINVSNENTVNFSDVTGNEWYADYINTAVKLKIATGYSNDLFGIGETLTRQDMAVMIYRLKGCPTVEEDTVLFTDRNNISDYAEVAVAYLANNGILNGFDNGEFKPHGKSNRAQAASVIYRLMAQSNGKEQ